MRHQFTVYVWVGIIGNLLIGPFKLPPQLSGASYLHILTEELPQLLEDVPLATRQAVWFMHDGASAHFTCNVKQFLDSPYPDQSIG
jgi:hypothetical protein